MTKKSLHDFKADIYKYKLSLMCLLETDRLGVLYGYANGCGSASAWFDFVPDTNYGVDISSPCHCHDIRWHLATSYTELVDANRDFARDLEKVVKKESNWATVWFRRRRNKKYFLAVKALGTNDYARERGFVLPVEEL